MQVRCDIAHGNSPAKVFYDPDEEAFYYRISGGDAEKCLDFDAGKTDGAGYPTSAIVGYIKAAWNFLYLHAPRIRHYDGTLAEFMTDADWAQRPITSETTEEERERIEQARSRVNTANKYWCHSEGGSAAGDYLLKRYDFADGEWVDAGLWNGTQYAQIDLRTYEMTAAAWNALTEAERNQSAIVNKAFVDAIVADCRTNIGNYFKVSSLKFHYCFQNHFIAGTDNCSKNTYYVLDPVTHLFELHQDDVDTTLATDNSGLQSKPYYIDRMHPYGGANAERIAMTGDVDNANILYEGYYNVLFDLVELMYEPTGELQAMMRTIFSEMASLTGGIGSDESDAMSGVWKALNRYIFHIQRYFPATVFNEAARIRYELPELIGYLSDIRSIHPIKQSMGDQLQAELIPINLDLRHFNLQMGVRYDYMHYRNTLEAKHILDVDLKDEHFISYRARVNYNSEDNWYFPTRGSRFYAEYAYMTDNFAQLDGKAGMSDVRANWRKSFTFGSRFTLQPMFYGRLLLGANVPTGFENTVGGEWFGHYVEQQMPFAGIGNLEHVNRQFIAAQLQSQLRMGNKHYLLFRIAGAQQSRKLKEILDHRTVLGAQLAYYIDTMFGPLGASLGYSTYTKKPYLYVNLGFEF